MKVVFALFFFFGVVAAISSERQRAAREKLQSESSFSFPEAIHCEGDCEDDDGFGGGKAGKGRSKAPSVALGTKAPSSGKAAGKGPKAPSVALGTKAPSSGKASGKAGSKAPSGKAGQLGTSKTGKFAEGKSKGIPTYAPWSAPPSTDADDDVIPPNVPGEFIPPTGAPSFSPTRIPTSLPTVSPSVSPTSSKKASKATKPSSKHVKEEEVETEELVFTAAEAGSSAKSWCNIVSGLLFIGMAAIA